MNTSACAAEGNVKANHEYAKWFGASVELLGSDLELKFKKLIYRIVLTFFIVCFVYYLIVAFT